MLNSFQHLLNETLESIVAKRKRSAVRSLRDEEDPLAGVPKQVQGDDKK